MPRLRDKKYQKEMEGLPPFTEKDVDDETFKIGQCYESDAATSLRCKSCKGTNFKVGVGDCYTAIKCVNCDWQECIHDA